MTTKATEPAAEKQHGAEEEPEVETSSVILLFTGLMLAMFMFSLNQTMLATALPTIVGDLNGVDQMLWVSTAFMLASTIMMPIYGKLGDSFNRKKIFIFAICMFILGSIVGFLAHNMAVLITARVIQGLGGGGLIILSQALIAAVVPARKRGPYMGIMGANFAVTSVAGSVRRKAAANTARPAATPSSRATSCALAVASAGRSTWPVRSPHGASSASAAATTGSIWAVGRAGEVVSMRGPPARGRERGSDRPARRTDRRGGDGRRRMWSAPGRGR